MHASLPQNRENRPVSFMDSGQSLRTEPAMILEQDALGVVTGATASAAKLLNTSAGELIGLRLLDVVTARQHPQLLTALHTARRTGRADVAVELKQSARVSAVTFEIRARGSSFVTRLRPGRWTPAAETPAQLPSALSSDKLADVSHEIRTPLNAVIGFADALRQESFGPLGDTRYRDYARLIQESGQHVLELINDLLDLSKAEANKMVVDPRPVHIGDLVSSTTAMVRLEAEKAGLVIRCETAPAVGVRNVDAKVVKQIVLNLLSNALKFTREGGIIVRTRLMGGELVISVEDSGIGMSRGDLEKIGERFYQARREGVRGGRGSGLGLALSAALAKSHGGRLDLTSQEGRGTVATLALPVAAAGEVESSPRRYKALGKPGKGDVVTLYRRLRRDG